MSDSERTPPPPSARVTANTAGFVVAVDARAVASVRWDDIELVFAYVQFVGGAARLYLDFVLAGCGEDDRDDDHRVRVHDHLDGWSELVGTLPEVLQRFDREWRQKINHDGIADLLGDGLGTALPTFVGNVVEVWRRDRRR